MAKIQVYDKPMCCSTGICGPQVDPILPRFAADLEWLETQAHEVERFNLAQQPAAFAENAVVKAALAAESVECLPLILVDGSVVSRAVYPSREQLAALASGSPGSATSAKSNALPVADSSGDCCGGTGSC